MEALSIDSPMNSTTLLREMEYIDPNVVKDRDLDIYKKKKDEEKKDSDVFKKTDDKKTDEKQPDAKKIA